MATLNTLKDALLETAKVYSSSQKQPLSDEQYCTGFDIFLQDSVRNTYQEFVRPQLNELVASLTDSRKSISVLEIGPGPRSVFGGLSTSLRQKVARYAAYEPNDTFADKLERWLDPISRTEVPLPCLRSAPNVRRIPFHPREDQRKSTERFTDCEEETYDIILFCHSMYGMRLKHKVLEKALEMLAQQPTGGVVVVFHRDNHLYFNGLVCSKTASFPGIVQIKDEDEQLDNLAAFIAGFTLEDKNLDQILRAEWRNVCRMMAQYKSSTPGQLLFSSPDAMFCFKHEATALPELLAQVPLAEEMKKIKNREAHKRRAAAIVRPLSIQQVQSCVQWALKYRLALTIVGGGHSGQCIQGNVVALDMGAFNRVDILAAERDTMDTDNDNAPLIVVEAGCTQESLVRAAASVGLAVPHGGRPTVGVGLWLQGGFGHLARLYGLACDAIIGVVFVSVESGQMMYIGHVPSQYLPAEAIRSKGERELLWTMKGAGPNFGVVISVTFKAGKAQTYSIENSIVPLGKKAEMRTHIIELDHFCATNYPRSRSVDAYLFWSDGQLKLCKSMLECRQDITRDNQEACSNFDSKPTTVDDLGLFDAEFHMSSMHGGHKSGKTSSFKRCVFIKQIQDVRVADRLYAALESSPSPLCYIHLLQGGGAVRDVADNATAFGCRDWDFACVITGIWPRDEDGTKSATSAIQWVYDVANDLLSMSSGSYSADLGVDPRDAKLASVAFGSNRLRLAHLKQKFDPWNVLAYACPLQATRCDPKLIVFVTGESGVGKDHCADVWVSELAKHLPGNVKTRVISISDELKRQYAEAVGADLGRLLKDRIYKEQHRQAMASFFVGQLRRKPDLPIKTFLELVQGASLVDALLITGMRDNCPVALLSHLVPNTKLLQVDVRASELTRQIRRRCCDRVHIHDDSETLDQELVEYQPDLIFDNDATGNGAAKDFARQHLLPLLCDGYDRLASMIRIVPGFPNECTEYRHVLGISQQSGGLALCTSLLQSQRSGGWDQMDAIACCEAGGFIYASALAAKVAVPLLLVREAGKLPPPTVSVTKPPSYISGLTTKTSKGNQLEIERDAIQRGASVVVVDDVLSTGETLCAVLQLLVKVGVKIEDIHVMIVVEFPLHKGRLFLQSQGFGRVIIRSLLVFEGN